MLLAAGRRFSYVHHVIHRKSDTNTQQALTYYYIRTLIYRPAVGSSLGQKAAPALMSIADSSKHVVQIIQLLEERSMIFSFCLNKCDLLTVCGMTLLYQAIGLKEESKLMREHERLVNSVIKMIDHAKAPGSWDFKRIAGRLVSVYQPANLTPPASESSREGSLSSPPQLSTAAVSDFKSPYTLGRHPDATASESDLHYQQQRARRMTMPHTAGQKSGFYHGASCQSLDSPQDSHMSQRQHRVSMSQAAKMRCQDSTAARQRQNLDYLSLGNTPAQSRSTSPPRHGSQMSSSTPQQQTQPTLPQGHMRAKVPSSLSSSEWEVILGQMEGGLNNVYDAIYGGQGFVNEQPPPPSQRNDWSPDSWDLSNFSIGEFNTGPAAPQSVLSLSDESLSSGEEIAPSELGLSIGSVAYDNNNNNNNMISATCGGHDGFVMEPLGNFPM